MDRHRRTLGRLVLPVWRRLEKLRRSRLARELREKRSIYLSAHAGKGSLNGMEDQSVATGFIPGVTRSGRKALTTVVHPSGRPLRLGGAGLRLKRGKWRLWGPSPQHTRLHHSQAQTPHAAVVLPCKIAMKQKSYETQSA
jgi:hypothetical protein